MVFRDYKKTASITLFFIIAVSIFISFNISSSYKSTQQQSGSNTLSWIGLAYTNISNETSGESKSRFFYSSGGFLSAVNPFFRGLFLVRIYEAFYGGIILLYATPLIIMLLPLIFQIVDFIHKQDGFK